MRSLTVMGTSLKCLLKQLSVGTWGQGRDEVYCGTDTTCQGRDVSHHGKEMTFVPITTHLILSMTCPIKAMMCPTTVEVFAQPGPVSPCPHVTFSTATHVPVADLAQLPTFLVWMVEPGAAVVCKDTGT